MVNGFEPKSEGKKGGLTAIKWWNSQKHRKVDTALFQYFKFGTRVRGAEQGIVINKQDWQEAEQREWKERTSLLHQYSRQNNWDAFLNHMGFPPAMVEILRAHHHTIIR